MELQDLANVKHIKVMATTGVATVAVATSTSPVLAHADTYPQSGSQTTYTSQDGKDCGPDGKPIVSKPITTVTTTPVSTTVTVTPPTTTTTKPVDTPTPVTTPAPVTTAEAPVTPASVTPEDATPKPDALPNTGAGDLVAPVAGVGILGYLGNMFRLKRKAKHE